MATDAFEESLRLAEEAGDNFQYGEALRQVLGALKLAEQKNDAVRQSRAHADHARLLSRLGLFAEAVSAAHAALRLAEDDAASAARALGALGNAQQTLSPSEGGMPVFELMLVKAREADDVILEARALRGLCAGNLILHQMTLKNGVASDSQVLQRYALAAQNHAVEATTICLHAGDTKGAFLGRHLQVGAAMVASDLPRARLEGIALLRSLEDASSGQAAQHRAITLKLLGQIELRDEDVAAAEGRTFQALLLPPTLLRISPPGLCRIG